VGRTVSVGEASLDRDSVLVAIGRGEIQLGSSKNKARTWSAAGAISQNPRHTPRHAVLLAVPDDARGRLGTTHSRARDVRFRARRADYALIIGTCSRNGSARFH
jgi:hypothetical protein